jgi:hypothetical protein
VPLKRRPALIVRVQRPALNLRIASKDGEVLYLNPESRRQTTARLERLPEDTLEQTAAGVVILRVDFVSKPNSKCEIATEVGDLLAEAGLHQKGLKASMLLVSDREARVVTLLTLWDGERFNPARERLTSWTLKIVAQFADGPLRASTSVAHFLLPKESTKLTLSDLRPAEIAELVEIVTAG